MSGDPPPRPPTIRVGPQAGATWTLVTTVAILVVIALVKPWAIDLGEPRPSLGERAVRPVLPGEATPGPTRDRSSRGLAEPFCLGAGSWRVVSDETWRNHEVRIWRAIEPLTDPVGARDPRIPSVSAIAFEVRAIGFCAPVAGPGAPDDAYVIEAFRVTSDRIEPVELRRLAPADEASAFGALFAPPSACVGHCPDSNRGSPVDPPPPAGPASWPAGRYVFRYSSATTGPVWFAVDVEQVTEVAPPGSTARPTPSGPP